MHPAGRRAGARRRGDRPRRAGDRRAARRRASPLPISIDTRKAGGGRAPPSPPAPTSSTTSRPCATIPTASRSRPRSGRPVCLMHAQGDPADHAGRARLRRRPARCLRLPRGARRRRRGGRHPARPHPRRSRHRLRQDRGAQPRADPRARRSCTGSAAPILFGASRKRFIGTIGGARRPGRPRGPGSLAVALEALRQGVQVIRVHDVEETRQAAAALAGAERREE